MENINYEIDGCELRVDLASMFENLKDKDLFELVRLLSIEERIFDNIIDAIISSEIGFLWRNGLVVNAREKIVKELYKIGDKLSSKFKADREYYEEKKDLYYAWGHYLEDLFFEISDKLGVVLPNKFKPMRLCDFELDLKKKEVKQTDYWKKHCAYSNKDRGWNEWPKDKPFENILLEFSDGVEIFYGTIYSENSKWIYSKTFKSNLPIEDYPFWRITSQILPKKKKEIKDGS